MHLPLVTFRSSRSLSRTFVAFARWIGATVLVAALGGLGCHPNEAPASSRPGVARAAVTGPTKLAFTSVAQTVTAGRCSAANVKVQSQDSSGTPTAVSANTPVALSGPGLQFFSDSACLSSISSTTIPQNSFNATPFYFGGTAAGHPGLRAAATGLTSATQAETVDAASPSKLAFLAQPQNITANQTLPTITVQVLDRYGNLTPSTATVALSGAPLLGTTSAAAVSGVATFSGLTVDSAATYTLTAASDPLTAATSNAFTVTAASASGLAFSTISDTTPLASFSTTVTVVDSYNNTVSTWTTPITLSIGNNVSNGVLGGTLQVTPAGGVASFSGLSLNITGYGYTLSASSGALTGQSQAFNILADVYVSPAGSDTPPPCGALSAPCKTIGAAQLRVQTLAGQSPHPITVMLRGNAGPFWSSGNLSFGNSDSGSATNPVLWTNYPGEAPVISGGFPVTSAWTKVAINGGYKWTTSLPAGTVDFGQLFIIPAGTGTGVRKYTPRAPAGSSGYLYNAGPVCLANTDPTFNSTTCIIPSSNSPCPAQQPYECFDRFKYSGSDLSSAWQDISISATNGGRANPIIVDDFEDWSVPKLRLQSVSPGIAYLTGATSLNAQFHGFLNGHRYVVENVKDYLTSQSGTYFVDESLNPWTLSYFTTTGEDLTTETVVVPQQAQLLTTASNSTLQYVTFRGITFSHDNFTVATSGYVSTQSEPKATAAVSFTDASHITLDGCTFTNLQGYGLEFVGGGTRTGTGHNQVLNSSFYDLGVGGMRIGLQAQNVNTDQFETGNNTVQNNLVAGAGRFAPGAPLIFVGNSDSNLIQYNDLYDGYGDGISICVPNPTNACSEWGNTIQYNHVRQIKQGVTSDGGGIYIFSYNLAPSVRNLIQYNWVHDVDGDPGPGGYGGQGIYLDNESTNITVQFNLVYHVSAQAMFVNFGFGHTLTNNIFAYGRQGVIGRGNKVPTQGALTSGPAFTATRNIFYWDTNVTTTHIAAQSLGFWDCWGNEGYPCTTQFSFDQNVYWNPTSGVTPEFIVAPEAGPTHFVPLSGAGSWQTTYLEDTHNSSFSDPQFTNAVCGADFTLPTPLPSALTAIGFTPLTFTPGRTSNQSFNPTLGAAWPLQNPTDPCSFY